VPPPPAQGELDDVVQLPAEGGVAEDFPPPPQLPDLEMVEDPDTPQGENQEGWQVDADQDEAAGYEGIDGDTYVVRGNGNRVLDAGQLDPNNGEQVGVDQEELAEYHRRIRKADEGVEDGGDQGKLAGGDQGAQGQIATGPGSSLSPGNSPPPRVAPALTGPEAIQLKLRQKKDEVARLRVLRDQVEQGELEVRYQAGRDREEAHQQAKKLAAQGERTRQKAERKRIKTREAEEKKTKKVTKQGPEDGRGASGWVQVPMRDDHGCVLYDQSGHVKYHPQDGLQDGQTKKKKKPPPVRPNSPPSPTTPMATSTPATRASTRTRTTPGRLQDYIHGAELDSDSLGLLPVQDYDQSNLSNLLNESSDYIQMRIQSQEEELRSRNAQDQAVIQRRLYKGPRNASPRED
jgi:hypothetical protein